MLLFKLLSLCQSLRGFFGASSENIVNTPFQGLFCFQCHIIPVVLRVWSPNQKYQHHPDLSEMQILSPYPTTTESETVSQTPGKGS